MYMFSVKITGNQCNCRKTFSVSMYCPYPILNPILILHTFAIQANLASIHVVLFPLANGKIYSFGFCYFYTFI